MPLSSSIRYRYAVVAERENVKAVKNALQARGVFARVVQPLDGDAADVRAGGVDAAAAAAAHRTIDADVNHPAPVILTTTVADADDNARREGKGTREQRFLLHTTVLIPLPAAEEDADELPTTLAELPSELKDVPHVIYALAVPVDTDSASNSGPSTSSEPSSPVYTALSRYLHAHPPTTASTATLLATAPKRYSFYPPLLLLPTGSFSSDQWKTYIQDHPNVLSSLASSIPGTTHIAVNAPIHASSIVRRPSRLWKLYPLAWAQQHAPETEPRPSDGGIDFSSALWVQTTQTGITQTWPPEHVMFSRGNITEKARLLSLPPASVRAKIVADLYAGIGYFVFSYLKAGAGRVYCWEVNPWSVESLRRGCALNGWKCRVVREGEGEEWGEEWRDGAEADADVDVRVVIFHESNETAVRRISEVEEKRGLGTGSVKMMHVNLGYLPSSRPSWGYAVELVDKNGGTVHVHENVAEAEIGSMAEVVVREMEGMWGRLEGEGGSVGAVRCEKIVKVKTFAPGVWHVVYDVRFGEMVGETKG